MAIDANMAGQAVACPSCGQVIQIPAAARVAPYVMGPDQGKPNTLHQGGGLPAVSTRRRQNRTIRKRNVFLWPTLFVIIGCASVIFVVMHQQRPAQMQQRRPAQMQQPRKKDQRPAVKAAEKPVAERPVPPAEREVGDLQIFEGEAEDNFGVRFEIKETGFYSFRQKTIPDANIIITNLFRREGEVVGRWVARGGNPQPTTYLEAGHYTILYSRVGGRKVLYKITIRRVRSVD